MATKKKEEQPLKELFKDTGLIVLTVEDTLDGTAWGWLRDTGELVLVPGIGGQHEVVANQVCALLGISDSLTMEKMGWIRIDGADVRTSHCPELGCMTKEQHKFLVKSLSALKEPERGSREWEEKREFRFLLAHANVPYREHQCPNQGGKLITRTKAGKKVL